MTDNIVEKLRRISLSMFRQDFFGIFHGSISARIEMSKFLINKREAIFDDMDEEAFILLRNIKDYRWNDASMDSEIHSSIYQKIPDAKFIAYATPPFSTAYSLCNNYLVPSDYFGKKLYPNLKIYDPKNTDDWYERADVEIPAAMIEADMDILLIKGYGIYAYAREINDLPKKIAIVENSCKILLYSKI